MIGLYFFLASVSGFAVGFGLATYFWTQERYDLSGELIGAAVQLADAVDRDVLVQTRLESYRRIKKNVV